MPAFDLTHWAASLKGQRPQDIIKTALSHFPGAALSFSGAEDVVLIDMARKTGLPFRTFTLDTGRLHAETYRFLERVREHFAIDIEFCFAQPEALAELTRSKGLFSFYREGHSECCSIRKVEPLRRHLAGFSAWITGQRRDQSPGTRADIVEVHQDTSMGDDSHPLIKFNPLAGWSSEDVWNYLRAFELPYNELHERGFVSIGCEPCTRPTLPGQHEREGRWWWEDATKKECGLHLGNLTPPAP